MTADDAIRSAIFDVVQGFTQPSDGLKSSYPPNVVVTRLWPVMGVDATQYGNAWSPTNAGGDPAAAENLSLLIDPIPILSDAYAKSGRGVEEEYSNVLDFAAAQRGTMMALAAGAAVKRGKPRGDDARVPDIVARELAERTEQTIVTPQGKQITTFVMSDAAKESSRAAIQYANQLAKLAVVRKLQPDSPPTKRHTLVVTADPNKDAAVKAFLNLKTTQGAATAAATDVVQSASLDSFNDPATAIDRAFSKAKDIFTRSAFGSLRNPGLDYHPSYLSPEDWTDPKAAANWPHMAIPVQGGGSPIQLSLSFSRVDIARPWLIMSLFDLPGWHTLKGPGNLSSGDAKNNPGTFALLPISLIVARDILAVDQNTKATLYRAPGLQILAWVNNVMPFSPPS